MPTIGERFREWFEAPSYEEGVGVDGEAEGLPSEEEGVLGQAKRAELERGMMENGKALPCKKGYGGISPQQEKKCFLWYESNVEIRISLEGWGISDDTDAMVQTISRGISQNGDATPKPGVATPYRAISGRKVLYRCLIEQKRLYLTETLLNPQ